MKQYLEDPEYATLRTTVARLLSAVCPEEDADELIFTLDEQCVECEGDFHLIYGIAISLLEQHDIDTENLSALGLRVEAGLLELADIPVTTEAGVWISLALALSTPPLALIFEQRRPLLVKNTPHFSMPICMRRR